MEETIIGGDETRVIVRQRGSDALLVLEGQLELDSAARLREAAERLLRGSGDVSIDWQAARHVGAGAVQVMLALGAALAARGRTVRVSADAPDVRRYLEFAGLSDHFPVQIP